MASATDRKDGHLDLDLDLKLERTIDAPRALIWKVWTNPEHLKKWWTPAPWKTTECQIDLRPGGTFRTVVRSPEGQEVSHAGCYLEVIENEKIVWTTGLEPGFRPARDPLAGKKEIEDCIDILFTAIITFRERAGKTDYTALLLHRNEGDRKRHEEMGFHEGWSTALDQLIEVVRKLKG